VHEAAPAAAAPAAETNQATPTEPPADETKPPDGETNGPAEATNHETKTEAATGN